jgi:hypothetical protein
VMDPNKIYRIICIKNSSDNKNFVPGEYIGRKLYRTFNVKYATSFSALSRAAAKLTRIKNLYKNTPELSEFLIEEISLVVTKITPAGQI